MWAKIKDDLVAETEAIPMGDVTDFSNFMGAVIDDRAFAKHKAAIARARAQQPPRPCWPAARPTTRSATSCGRPIVQSTDPTDQMFNTEYFGPILAVHVYDDADYERVVQQMESFAPYALTGAVIAQDRARDRLDRRRSCASPPATSTSTTSRPARSSASSRSAARRASGTNDKAGAAVNLLRWTSPRSIKETFVPPTDYRYPYMG